MAEKPPKEPKESLSQSRIDRLSQSTLDRLSQSGILRKYDSTAFARTLRSKHWFQKYAMHPAVLGLVAGLIILIPLTFFLRPKSAIESDMQFDLYIKESVGHVAAIEAAKILGPKGGSAVLILPGLHNAAVAFPGSTLEAYQRGFEQNAAQQHPPIRLLRHHLGNPDADPRASNFDIFQAVHHKYPDAHVFISFIGLPRFDPKEEKQWRKNAPPKLIVAAHLTNSTEAERLIASGLVQAAFVLREVTWPDVKPTTPQEIFAYFYQILRP